MKDFLDNIREHDKQMGVPEFKGWQEREVEAHKKAQIEGLNIPIVTNNENNSEVAFCDSPIHDFDRCPFIKQRNDCKSCRYYN